MRALVDTQDLELRPVGAGRQSDPEPDVSEADPRLGVRVVLPDEMPVQEIHVEQQVWRTGRVDAALGAGDVDRGGRAASHTHQEQHRRDLHSHPKT